MSRFQERRQKLRKLLKAAGIPSLLVSETNNVSYLTGFTGDASCLLLTPSDAIVLSDGRFIEQLERECPDLDAEIRLPGTTFPELLERTVGKLKLKLQSIGLEADVTTLSTHEQLVRQLPNVNWVSTRGLVEGLREIKDAEELAAIRRAIDVAQRAFAVMRAKLLPSNTEKDLADELDHQIRQFGGAGCCFEPIVGVGPNGALPHYRAGLVRIEESPFVLIDWGARVGQYISDLTRVLVTGKIPPKLERLYGVVLTAQLRAIEAIRPGVPLEEVDAAARKVIEKAGFGPHFTHGLGHGIGMAVHESPRMAVKQRQTLKAGMVVTVEPGIYLPGWGGIRIEDDILVTRTGHEVLSSVPKALEDCVVH
ncbi:MAG: hypothetical protein RIS70_3475 [Planctomycetota bacterium]